MAKLTLTDLSSLTNETSAITAINANNTAIENALELTLSRNGTTPNEMSANIDMNGFRVLNLAAPVDDNDAVRLIDVVDGIQGPAGPPGGALADGDYGDVVVSSNGSVMSLDTTLANNIAYSVAAINALGNSAYLNTGNVAGTVASGVDTRFYKYVINNQNGDYTLGTNDTNYPTIVYHNSVTPHQYVINGTGIIAYETGSTANVINGAGAGALTLTRGSGVVFYLNGGISSVDVTVAPGGYAQALHLTSNVWMVTGVGLS